MESERKLIYVEWVDITSTDGNWRSISEAEDWADETNSIVRQTGFLLAKDDDFLVLTCSYLPELELVGTTIRIPTVTIKYIKEIQFDRIKES
jgi:hypothetical protein